jgi:DNA-binding transcriptional MerR regulator
MSTTIEIPNKSLFKMNEVCGLTGVKPYVLRFWESEFEEINPILSSAGQKLYEHKDIEAIVVVKNLLFDEKMTIEKAKAEMTLRYQASLDETIEVPKVPSTGIIPSALKEQDLERLVMAKTKLNQIMELTDSLKTRHHWN